MRPVLFLLAALALLAGCGSGADHAAHPPPGGDAPVPSAAPVSGEFNDADVMFLQMLIPHHKQGLTMARAAKDRARRAETRQLAAAVEATQRHELVTMSSWLRTWRQPISADPQAHAGHGEHGKHGDLPVTDPDAVTALVNATDAEFETTFLNLFTAHQHKAVELAQRETADGRNKEAKDLADRIVKSRTAQIEQLLKLAADR